jgi:acyl homoserine lactone synthase
MQTEQIRGRDITPAGLAAVAAYRYRIFVERLGWPLQCRQGHEADEFDVPDATHLVVRLDQDIVGYARMLPTTGPYLLEAHFAHLLNGAPPPKSGLIVELSRFAAGVPSAPGTGVEDDGVLRTAAGKRVLLAAIQHARAVGAHDLIFCTSVGIERLAKRWGVDIRRAGPPARIHGDLLVAAAIACNDRSLEALKPAPARARSAVHPVWSLQTRGHERPPFLPAREDDMEQHLEEKLDRAPA